MSVKMTIYSDDVFHIWGHACREDVVIIDANVAAGQPVDAFGYGNKVTPFPGGGEVQLELPPVAMKALLKFYEGRERK